MVELLRCYFADAVQGSVSGMDGVFLNTRQKDEHYSRAGAVALSFQTHAHDAIECEGKEADQGMGADMAWQAAMGLRDLEVGLQDAEAALDVGKTLLAGDSFYRGEVRKAGDKLPDEVFF